MSEGYIWHPPKAVDGQMVIARMHSGRVRLGKVMAVQTHYDKDRKAYHTFSIRFVGNERSEHLGESSILSVLAEGTEVRSE